MPPPCVKLKSNALLFRLIRSAVGHESDLVEFLKSQNKTNCHYKVFGKYDILEVSPLENLHRVLHTSNNDKIRSISSIACFNLLNGTDSVWEKIKPSISPALCLLKLQENVFRSKGLAGIREVAAKFHQLNDKAIPLIGMGYYEILLWLPFETVDEIFEYTNNIRTWANKDIFGEETEDPDRGVFLETNTIPMVSYDHVITPKEWHQLKGTVVPSVKIKCAPGEESTVLSKWDLPWKQLLGAEDLFYTWEEPTEYSGFIEQLIKFRTEWSNSQAVIDTATRIQSKDLYTPGNIVAASQCDDEFSRYLSEQLCNLNGKNGINQFIIGELINAVSLINTNIRNKASKSAYSDLVFSMMFYLNLMIEEYQRVAELNAMHRKVIIEDYLLAYVNCIQSAVLQHFPNKDFGDITDAYNRVPYSGSLSKVVRAVSTVIESIFRAISSTTIPAVLIKALEKSPENPELSRAKVLFIFPWKGFVFLNFNSGYRIIDQGEIITVPFTDAFDILSWATLSHEISHAYYQRVNFEAIEDQWIYQLNEELQKDMEKSVLALHIVSLKEFIYEVFAHWFDYKHFYNSDIDFYIWSIWRTWLRIPRIFKHRTHYWIRTLFILYCHNASDFKEQLIGLEREEKKKKAIVLMGSYISKIDEFLCERFAIEYEKIKLDPDEILHVIQSVMFISIAQTRFENSYNNIELIEKLKEDKLSEYIGNLKNGEVIEEKIGCPYALLIELLRLVYKQELVYPLPNEITMSLIMSLWASSRYYERPFESDIATEK